MINLIWALEADFLSTMLDMYNRIGDYSLFKKSEAATRYAALTARNPENSNPKLKVISCYGPIIPFANLFSEVCGSVSIEAMRKEFSAALNDDKVETILFDFNSPGGNVEEIAAFAGEIYAARGKKQIVSFAGGLCCSAAYWLAAATEKIYTDRTTKIGSIGVMTSISKSPSGTIALTNTASNKKAVDPNTEEGREEVIAVLNDTAAVFFSDISAYRKIEIPDIQDFKGRVFVGAKAVKNRLADEITDFNSLYTKLTTGENSMAMTAEEKAAMDALNAKVDTLTKENSKLKTDLDSLSVTSNQKIIQTAYTGKLNQMTAAGLKENDPAVANFKAMFGKTELFANQSADTVKAMIDAYQIPPNRLKINLGYDNDNEEQAINQEVPEVTACV